MIVLFRLRSEFELCKFIRCHSAFFNEENNSSNKSDWNKYSRVFSLCERSAGLNNKFFWTFLLNKSILKRKFPWMRFVVLFRRKRKSPIDLLTRDRSRPIETSCEFCFDAFPFYRRTWQFGLVSNFDEVQPTENERKFDQDQIFLFYFFTTSKTLFGRRIEADRKMSWLPSSRALDFVKLKRTKLKLKSRQTVKLIQLRIKTRTDDFSRRFLFDFSFAFRRISSSKAMFDFFLHWFFFWRRWKIFFSSDFILRTSNDLLSELLISFWLKQKIFIDRSLQL